MRNKGAWLLLGAICNGDRDFECNRKDVDISSTKLKNHPFTEKQIGENMQGKLVRTATKELCSR